MPRRAPLPSRLLGPLVCVVSTGCAPPSDADREWPTPGEHGDHGGGDTGATGSAEPAEDSGGDGLDDAVLVAATLPTSLDCGESFDAQVTMRNTGTTTWDHDGLYKLGAVDDDDPLYDTTRVWLDTGDVVPPGAEHTFQFSLQAGDSAATVTTDWQMVHEYVAWFGEPAAATATVACDDGDDDGDSTVEPDLDDVTWLHTDVGDWTQASTLHSVTVDDDQICLDYDAADVWPADDTYGDEVVGNPWIFILHTDGEWYAATWEWLRPGQTCKSREAVAGSHIKQEPFPEDGGWVPTSGHVYWFMVSGLARYDGYRNVEERTNLVRVVWP